MKADLNSSTHPSSLILHPFLLACFIVHRSSFILLLRVILDPDHIFGGDALSRFFVTGGAGFIGGHLVARLLQKSDAQVVVYDNFSSGRSWHLQPTMSFNPEPAATARADEKRLQVISGDIKDLSRLREAMAGADAVFHLASNPDIARAVRQPDIDFWEGTYLTQNVLEAMRQNGVSRLIYSSGSGVYGDTSTTPVVETYSPMRPISTYGASKLAGEALICSYCHMFDMHALAFRFANVVGPRQTHGVAYDFVLRLLRNPAELQILGDGSQSKSYIHVDDVLDAMLLLHDQSWQGFDVFNVATEDYVTVLEFSYLVVRQLRLDLPAYPSSGPERRGKVDVLMVR